MLNILLLGPPELNSAGQPFEMPRRRNRALLYYLAARGEPVSRVELIDLFFSESGGDDDARRRLREALSKIRAALPDPAALVAEGDRVWLDPRLSNSDISEFNQIIRQLGSVPWQLPPAQPLPAAVYQQLYRAIRLWRSARFMAGADLPDGDLLDEWLTVTTSELETTRGKILQRLAAHSVAAGDREAALHWVRMALESDELNESLHYQVLDLLASLGRRTEAVKYFGALQDLYRRELNAAPPAAIQSLLTRLQSEFNTPAPTDRPGWPVSLSMQAPFVGRERVLNDLRLTFHRGGLVAVFGEAGAGKSRLVQELFFSIEPVPRLLLAPSHPQETRLPFQPLIELLRHSIQPEDWQRLSPVWASQLSILLPDLLMIRPELPPRSALAPEQARALLFEAFRQLFTLLAQKQRLLFFLDDAQWADEATLATLSYLVERSFFNEHGLLVIAARPEEPNLHLEELMAQSHGASVFLQVNLEQLTEEEIASLASFALGRTPSPEFVGRLAHETGGNPFFLLETLRAILDLSFGPDLSHIPEALPLASSIHILVRNRLRTLTPNARQALTAAAVVGNEFSPRMIELVNHSSAEEVVQILDELERARLVRPSRGDYSAAGDPTYYFVHDKIREVIELELSPARKRLLHQRAGQALEEILGANAALNAPVLARHFELGGSTTEAYRYWVLSGQRARQLFSLTEAYAAFRRAENLSQALGSNLTDDSVYLLYSSWGELALEASDQETLSRVYNKLLHIGQSRHSQLLVGAALSGLSSLALLRGRYPEALIYADQAAPFLERSASLFELTQGLVRRGTILRMLYRFPEATQSFRAALDASANTLDAALLRVRSSAHYQLSLVLTRTGQPVEAARQAELALEQTTWTTHPLSEARSYHALAMAYFHLGQYELALQHSLKGVELAERINSWTDAARLHIKAARIEFALGRLDNFWTHLQQGFSFAERSGSLPAQAEAYSLRAELYRYSGDIPAAIQSFQRALTSGTESYEALDSLVRLGTCLAQDGRIADGLMYIEQAYDFAKKAGLQTLTIAAEITLARVRLMSGEREAAAAMAEQLEQTASRCGFATLPSNARLLRAQVLLAGGQAAQCAELCQATARQAAEIHNPWLEINALSQLARAQAAQDQTDPAVFARLESLLDQLASSATHSQLQLVVSNFRRTILEKTP